MDHAVLVASILKADKARLRVLEMVSELELPDCWIGAGFVRNAVWDALHEREVGPLDADVDVIWFDRRVCDPKIDRGLEELLRKRDPAILWSVKNQARMHTRNGDRPYRSASDAMCFWPETATAIAARLAESGDCELSAPFGLSDLVDLVLRPTPRFADAKRPIFEERARKKAWLTRWPRINVLAP